MQQTEAQQTDIEGFRPSIQQAGLWHNAASGASAVLRADINEAVAPVKLRQALEWAVARHEILRTRLQSVPGMQLPVQVIRERAEFGWHEIDATQRSPADAEAQESHLIAEMRASVDLLAQPVLAAALIQQAPKRFRLLLVAPLANADAGTMQLLLQELAQSYWQSAASEADPVQYADFAEWQHELLAGPESDPGRAFWRRQIDPALLKVKHPFERQGGGSGGFLPARQERYVDARWTDRLLTVAAAMNTSPASILAVCWSALLQRQLGLSAVVLGWRHNGRNEATRAAFGPYAKALPLLSRQDDAWTLKALAEAQDALFAQAQAWQDSFNWGEFATVAEAPNLPLIFEYSERAAGAGDWRVAGIEAAAEPFALWLSIRESGEDDAGGMSLALRHDANRFSAQSADNLLDQLATLVERACKQTDIPLLSIGSLSSRQGALLAALNQTEVRIDSAQLLHQFFEAQAAQQPEAIAVEFGKQQLRYGELNRRANRLAHRLRREGVTPECPVGLYLGRSLEAVVGILGILKAGGAYLPLDPSYPAERLAFMLEETAAPIILTVAGLADKLPASRSSALLLDDENTFAGCSSDNPVPVNPPDSLAYIIFTSGSTGQPKGVMVSHRNAVHSTTARWHNYALQCESFLLSSSFSFDSSVAGLFWALSQGGKLCLPGDAEVQDTDALARLIETHRASHVLMLSSLYGQLLETQAATRLASLKCVIVAGEACLAAVAARHHAKCPQAQLYNEYGPTEGSVWCTLYKSKNDEGEGGDGGGVLPIGQPIANMRVYVLDKQLTPVPPGIAGEITIGGAGIVRGYLEQPELTAERFVPDPFGIPGGRLYRTGDIGRFDAGACLEFLGRTDHQVKIRGFRIELGEIEARLVEHAAVREAAVIARKDTTGNMRLIAYLVIRGACPAIALLQQHLKQHLPEHMVPAAFMVLDALPLTPNGKLDRAALPEPEKRSRRAYLAPRNEAEALLAQIWSDVLGIERVGLDDDFFELGGHSLVATKLVSRVRSLMGREVAVRSIFQHPRLMEFAGHVMQQASSAALPPITAAPRNQPLPLSFAQQRLWFFDRLHPHSVAYNVPGAVRLRGALNIDAMQRSFTELVRRHEALRTTFRFDDGPVQIIEPARPVPLPLVSVVHLDAAERDAQVRLLLEAEAQTPFDLMRGPLLRTGLIRLDEREHVLWLTLHHIISDGWSMQVLVRELDSLYQAFSRDQPSPLPEPAIQYADFAVWQRQYLQGDTLRRQLDYWKQQLGDTQPVLQLPGMRPRSALQNHRGAAYQFAIDQVQVERLNALCEGQGVTLFMALLAVFKVLLAGRSGQHDIRIGVPIANRNRLELEGLIGFFVNTLVLRGEMEGELSFVAFLQRVRETVLTAHANQDLPFEQLVEALHPRRDPSCSPLFQVMFDVHRGRIVGSGGFGGLALESMPGSPSRTVLFDLMLDIAEQEQGMLAAFTYNTDLFDEAAIAALAQDYLRLIESIAAEPDVVLGVLMQHLHAPVPAQRADSCAAAPTVLEQVLAAMREVLGCETLDPQAGFFAQGGTSLQALTLIHRLNRRWSADIPLQLIFLHQVIADFARVIGPYARHPH